ALLPVAEKQVADDERSLLKALCFGLARHSIRLQALIDPLLQKKLKAKDLDVFCLMQIGVLQLETMNMPDHAAVNTTVAATKALNKPWAKGLVNAVLRNYQRQRDSLIEQLCDSEKVAFPAWLHDQVKKDWPSQALSIFEQSNLQAPMVLRVNSLLHTRDEYMKTLKSAGIVAKDHAFASQALVLEEAMDVKRIPFFSHGAVSVQDAAAQMASSLLHSAVTKEQPLRILDACAAPGGKTSHLAELFGQSHITALDVSLERLRRVDETVQRLGLQERVSTLTADAVDVKKWWDGRGFDAVLLDAPCSGTGVIRRHPDIKLLRRESDIKTLVETQSALLEALWQTLAPSGFLLYATCSILKSENVEVVEKFCLSRPEATVEMVSIPGAIAESVGQQLLPVMEQSDGFFYALLKKSA
ncbi:MAG: 16S rRNA (cytosine(967)-C(5))-methyltransferase RsmB, partial [Gammaproteobacteria bacterium]|nr:16S rRNA (cytosine(967)-C(5))-methyltransferase RsmB [Gammaproteobacteria bacterium]